MKLISFIKDHPAVETLQRRCTEFENFYMYGGNLYEFRNYLHYLLTPLVNIETFETGRRLPVMFRKGLQMPDPYELARSLTYPHRVISSLNSLVYTTHELGRYNRIDREHLIFDVYYPRLLIEYLRKMFLYKVKPSRYKASLARPWHPCPGVLVRLMEGMK